MKKWIILSVVIIVSLVGYLTMDNRGPKPSVNSQGQMGKNVTNNPIYELELSRWRVYNNGTNGIQTTKGINSAIKWAIDNGFNTVKIPDGTYLIAKGTQEDDPDARINLVSNMTLLLSDNTEIKKETNGFEIYSTIYLGPDVENITITGGTLSGDRDTHDYSQKGPDTDGTHEWGYGIRTEGPKNIVIDGVKIEKFTGDGIIMDGTTIYGQYITAKDLELGGIDDNGAPISQKGKIRSNNYKVENFSNPIYKNDHYRNLMMWLPEGVEGYYDLFYYRKDGSFIKADKDQHFNSTWGYSHIPNDADYFRVVFNSNSTKGVQVNRMTVAVTENMTIKNCDIGFNRRQGITVGASDVIQIINNTIHDTNGTAPQSGIDIEPGFYPAINTLIKGNQFNNNIIHMVFSYGGNANVEENYFGPNGESSVGFSINPSYDGATVTNNTFDHTNFVTWNNTKFLNNKLVSSSASFDGGTNNIVDGIEGTNSRIGFTQTDRDGIKVSNIVLQSSTGSTTKGGIEVYGEPIQLTNITLKGNNDLSGEGNVNNVYDHVDFINSPEMSLPLGVYSNCTTNNGIFELDSPGKIVLNNCSFKNTTFYTYDLKTEATIQNSTFNFDKDETNPIIVALQAKNINVLNNTINDVTKVKVDHAIIQIGRDSWQNNPTNVFGATIKGNRITAKVKRVGIDTINGGKGAPPYDVEDNILTNATLKLKSTDINKNNQLLSQ
ncbi:right-handed parallel beta-helix repeat-containing protein [Heyndrickxia sp. NPDC080065]|uniref:right-handed parallel beta-helix repeat-containing protein n=1 Tax=Heyndrickxia sp. NPDC080065 TaxID=3390568 RepID=UPI003D0642D2